MFAFVFAALVLASPALSSTVQVVNRCSFDAFLFTQTSDGTIKQNNVFVAPGATLSMGVSSDWNGAINVGTGCNSNGVCETGGPTWNGQTPFSRAEINFWGNPGKVWYDVSQIYGSNVGMQISTGDGSCPAFSCDGLSNGCPVPGPSVAGQWNSCFSPCCSSADACNVGALPAGGGGCVKNAGPGPNSPFFYQTCPNAYAFPDNDGAAGYTPANFVDYICPNVDVTLTLCPGGASHYLKQ